jgi:hypothetical protein
VRVEEENVLGRLGRWVRVSAVDMIRFVCKCAVKDEEMYWRWSVQDRSWLHT